MKAWLVERGVPAAAVIEDGSGVNTRATARFTVSWMKANSARSVIAVSQYFHLPRIRLALSQEGLADVRIAAADRFILRDARWLLREAAAYLKYLIRLG